MSQKLIFKMLSGKVVYSDKAAGPIVGKEIYSDSAVYLAIFAGILFFYSTPMFSQ